MIAERIGFVGLGVMGKPMALNLLRAGLPLSVYSRRPESMSAVIAAGAKVAESIDAIGRECGVVILMVTDTPDVAAVISGPQGLKEVMAPGSVVVDMSTIDPNVSRSLAKELADQNIDMLDAPVSGGEVGAVNASLSIMVGGKTEVFARVQPLFEKLGKQIIHVGDHGAGQVAKACNQIIVGITIQAVAEALVLAEMSGVDAAKVRQALLGGFAASRVLEVHGERMLNRAYQPGFKARLHHKDLRIALEMAEKARLSLPATKVVVQGLQALIKNGSGDFDHAALAMLLQEIAD